MVSAHGIFMEIPKIYSAYPSYKLLKNISRASWISKDIFKYLDEM